MNEQRTILEESVSRLFAAELDRAALTQIEESGWPEALWQQVIEQGMHKVLADEAADGMDGCWADAYPVVRACGYYALPLPLPETLLAEWLARMAGLALPAGVPGLLTRPLAALAASKDTLEQVAAQVPWGRRADYLLGICDTRQGSELIVAASADCAVVEEDNLGRDPRDHLNGTGVRILDRRPLPLPADAVHWLGALLRSAQIAGAGAACLDLAVKYASEREQFGRPLAAFQAIQHHLADLAGVMASVDAIAMAAFAALDRSGIAPEGRSARFEIAAAKCRASEAVEKLTRLSHQVHGAIGFTYEYGLHFLSRRLWAWRAEFGAGAEWGEYLGRVAIAQGGDGIWAHVTG